MPNCCYVSGLQLTHTQHELFNLRSSDFGLEYPSSICESKPHIFINTMPQWNYSQVHNLLSQDYPGFPEEPSTWRDAAAAALSQKIDRTRYLPEDSVEDVSVAFIHPLIIHF